MRRLQVRFGALAVRCALTVAATTASGIAPALDAQEHRTTPEGGPTPHAWALNWGPQRPDLLRYNRIEGPALGARLQLRGGAFLGSRSLTLEPFLGVADLDPRVELSVTGESLRRKSTVALYHRLRPASRGRDELGLGNSLGALIWGRDEGEYFGATGAEMMLSPPSAQPRSWSVRVYAEHQESLETHTDFTLVHAFEKGWRSRPNRTADVRDEVGAELVFAPGWGSDPSRPRAGLEAYGHVAGGDRGFARASVRLGGSVPFTVKSRQMLLAAEVEGGDSWGDPPRQRSWFLGGVTSLRGYEPSVLVGPTFLRLRAEWVHLVPPLMFSVFTDAGWAGPRARDFRFGDALASAGVSVGALDGLLRLDFSRAFLMTRDTRADLYFSAAR